jgi:hypothetical protein
MPLFEPAFSLLFLSQIRMYQAAAVWLIMEAVKLHIIIRRPVCSSLALSSYCSFFFLCATGARYSQTILYIVYMDVCDRTQQWVIAIAVAAHHITLINSMTQYFIHEQPQHRQKSCTPDNITHSADNKLLGH